MAKNDQKKVDAGTCPYCGSAGTISTTSGLYGVRGVCVKCGKVVNPAPREPKADANVTGTGGKTE